ncbi:MAG TPA: DUF222 domain-containing protein, partial [Actinomycetota bacterium]|nr:DUF222 domain-containing protein [Actinomycetota bacterium]
MPRPPLPSPAESSRSPTLQPWPTAPETCPTTPWPRLSRPWWRRRGGWTHPGCGGWSTTCAKALTPTPPTPNAQQHHQRRGCGRPRPGKTWSPCKACWTQRPARPAGRPGALARPPNADDPRSGEQRRADALVELARRALEAGQLPQAGGVRPQLLVAVDLDSLLGRPG